jgi:VWFA-related protein
LRLWFALALAVVSAVPGRAQSPPPSGQPGFQIDSQPDSQIQTITSQSALVVVPALVRDKGKGGQLVFTLKADDFQLSDDGIPQKLHLEQDTGGEPLALVVDIEGGGAGVGELAKLGSLQSMLDSVVGGVAHKIAVVGYDSSPVLVRDFTPNTDLAVKGIQALIDDNNGDSGAATLDSLGFSIDLLRKQPIQYRRAILLIAESHDRGSKLKLDDALREIGDTNTAIYAIGFSTDKPEVAHEVAKISQPDKPGPAHGCFSRDPNDPNVDLTKNPGTQAFDCLALLAPPLRLATIAFVAARDSLQKNVPETVARLTGGEYFKLTSAKSLVRDLQTISNHIPNRYVLSFQPQSPHPGFHAIALTVPHYVHLEVSARNGYWADSPALPAP